MIFILKWFFIFIMATFFLEVLFANAILLYEAAKKQKNYFKYIYYVILIPIVFIGYPFDIFYNYTFASLYFWEFPVKGEYTLTARLIRYVMFLSGWRFKRAVHFCKYYIEIWDFGHCRLAKYIGMRSIAI